MIFIAILGIFIFGVVAAALLIKPKELSEDEKKSIEEKKLAKEKADSDERERKRLEEKRLLEEAKVKAEADEIKLLEKQKAEAKSKAEEEERLRSEAESKSKAEEEERLKLEEQAKSEPEENESEIAKKPLEEVIKGKLRKSRPLSMNEQPMFTKLRTTLEPEYVVLAQVSFGAILWTWSHGVRNRFNRKIVDFVICDKGFNVIAVVELDDSSHKGKEERDAERDLLLNEAGITVLRYKFTPESSKILEDIKAIPQ